MTGSRPVERGEVVRADGRDLVVTDSGGDFLARVGDERDDHFVGPDRHDLGVGDALTDHAFGSCAAAATEATGQPPSALADPARCERSGPPAPTGERVVALVVGRGDRAAASAAIAAMIAAISSGVASGEIDRSTGCAHQRGTFPCLRGGSFSFLDRSISSDSTSTRRVSRGSMTSST